MSVTEPAATACDIAAVERPSPSQVDGWAFLSPEEARTIEALAERIMPGEPGSPGARDAKVVRYIDGALNEASQDLQTSYRSGIDDLNSRCLSEQGQVFAELGEALQDQILRDLGGTASSSVPGADPKVGHSLRTFFAIVREHTLQGMFCDPEYGGNYELAGWRLVGFPGAQWGYGPDHIREGFDSMLIPFKTLADLRREHPLTESPQAGEGS